MTEEKNPILTQVTFVVQMSAESPGNFIKLLDFMLFYLNEEYVIVRNER